MTGPFSSRDECRLYCGVVVPAPGALEKFVEQDLLAFGPGGDHPVLSVLVGAKTKRQASAVLEQRLPLEFPLELVVDVRLEDITASLPSVREAGWLTHRFGPGMVRIPPVYLLVDGNTETSDEAFEYVRDLFTG